MSGAGRVQEIENGWEGWAFKYRPRERFHCHAFGHSKYLSTWPKLASVQNSRLIRTLSEPDLEDMVIMQQRSSEADSPFRSLTGSQNSRFLITSVMQSRGPGSFRANN